MAYTPKEFGLSEAVREQVKLAGFALNAERWAGPAPQERGKLAPTKDEKDAQANAAQALLDAEASLSHMKFGSPERTRLEGQISDLQALVKKGAPAGEIMAAAQSVQATSVAADAMTTLGATTKMAMADMATYARERASSFAEYQESFARYEEQREEFSSMLASRGYDTLTAAERHERESLGSEIDSLNKQLAEADTEEEKSRIRLRILELQGGVLDIDQQEAGRAADEAHERGDTETEEAARKRLDAISADRAKRRDQLYEETTNRALIAGKTPEEAEMDASRAVAAQLEIDLAKDAEYGVVAASGEHDPDVLAATEEAIQNVMENIASQSASGDGIISGYKIRLTRPADESVSENPLDLASLAGAPATSVASTPDLASLAGGAAVPDLSALSSQRMEVASAEEPAPPAATPAASAQLPSSARVPC